MKEIYLNGQLVATFHSTTVRVKDPDDYGNRELLAEDYVFGQIMSNLMYDHNDENLVVRETPIDWNKLGQDAFDYLVEGLGAASVGEWLKNHGATEEQAQFLGFSINKR